MEGTYLANYVQSVFNTLLESGVPVAGGSSGGLGFGGLGA